MNISAIQNLPMRIARMPKRLEELRTATRMNLYLEIKLLGDKMCPGQFTRAECTRMAQEVSAQLCGDPSPASPVPLTSEMQHQITRAILQIRNGPAEMRAAASFMHWSKAVGLMMKLKNREAEKELHEAALLDPNNYLALSSMGYLAGFNGNPKLAIELSEKALAINPKIPEAWIELGNAHEALGDHNAAMAAWEKARAMNPDLVKLRDQPTTGANLPGRDRTDYEVLTDDSEPPEPGSEPPAGKGS